MQDPTNYLCIGLRQRLRVAGRLGASDRLRRRGGLAGALRGRLGARLGGCGAAGVPAVSARERASRAASVGSVAVTVADATRHTGRSTCGGPSRMRRWHPYVHEGCTAKYLGCGGAAGGVGAGLREALCLRARGVLQQLPRLGGRRHCGSGWLGGSAVHEVGPGANGAATEQGRGIRARLTRQQRAEDLERRHCFAPWGAECRKRRSRGAGARPRRRAAAAGGGRQTARRSCRLLNPCCGWGATATQRRRRKAHATNAAAAPLPQLVTSGSITKRQVQGEAKHSFVASCASAAQAWAMHSARRAAAGALSAF